MTVLSTMTAASLLSGAATVMCPLVVSTGRVNKTLHENSMFNDIHEDRREIIFDRVCNIIPCHVDVVLER